MRILLTNAVGEYHTITSNNPKVIAEWLTDIVPAMERDAQHPATPPWRMEIYPSGNYSSLNWPVQKVLGPVQLSWIRKGFEIMDEKGVIPSLRVE